MHKPSHLEGTSTSIPGGRTGTSMNGRRKGVEQVTWQTQYLDSKANSHSWKRQYCMSKLPWQAQFFVYVWGGEGCQWERLGGGGRTGHDKPKSLTSVNHPAWGVAKGFSDRQPTVHIYHKSLFSPTFPFSDLPS